MPIQEIHVTKAEMLECIQNLLGAFDNPIVRRHFNTQFTEEAIYGARKLLKRINIPLGEWFYAHVKNFVCEEFPVGTKVECCICENMLAIRNADGNTDSIKYLYKAQLDDLDFDSGWVNAKMVKTLTEDFSAGTKCFYRCDNSRGDFSLKLSENSPVQAVGFAYDNFVKRDT